MKKNDYAKVCWGKAKICKGCGCAIKLSECDYCEECYLSLVEEQIAQGERLNEEEVIQLIDGE